MQDKDLIEFLQTHDVPCPICNHNLRALSTPRCPECGSRLTLSVVPRTSFPAPWIVAVVSSGIVACYAPQSLAWLLDSWGELWWWNWPYIVAFGSFVLVPVTVILVVWRRHFVAKPKALQWCAALALAALALGYTSVRWWNLMSFYW